LTSTKKKVEVEAINIFNRKTGYDTKEIKNLVGDKLICYQQDLRIFIGINFF